MTTLVDTMKYKLLIIVIFFLGLIALFTYFQKTNGYTEPISKNIDNKIEGMYLDINNTPLSYIKPEYIKDKDSFISESCKKEPNRYYL